MAFSGQFLTQMPQTLHAAFSSGLPFTISMAPKGQLVLQRPQPVHLRSRIAICAMVCDHIAWGFVEFMSPLGQVMHIIGRLTIPIMCFFVAEGFRHTASVKGYMKRMMLFWVVAILPFYLFFHDIYEYRQNIILDLMLGLFLLAVLENKRFRLWQKVLLTVCLFAISITVGGWIIMPMLYIFVFYYVRDFKKQAAWICGLTVALEIFLIVAVELNRVFHFSHYDVETKCVSKYHAKRNF